MFMLLSNAMFNFMLSERVNTYKRAKKNPPKRVGAMAWTV
jgi:hypothetical protein